MSRNRNPIEQDPFVRMMFREMPGAVWTTFPRSYATVFFGCRAPHKRSGARASVGMSLFDVLGTQDPTNPIIACHRAALFGESQSLDYEKGGRWYAIYIEPLVENVRIGCIGVACGTTLQISERSRNDSRVVRRCCQRRKSVAHVGKLEWDLATDRGRLVR